MFSNLKHQLLILDNPPLIDNPPLLILPPVGFSSNTHLSLHRLKEDIINPVLINPNVGYIERTRFIVDSLVPDVHPQPQVQPQPQKTKPQAQKNKRTKKLAKLSRKRNRK